MAFKVTEDAHKHQPKERLKIEQSTGALADFIARNKRKFD